jgi:hypothetical protein
MDKKIKARWVKALRSGKFKQGKKSLYQQTPKGVDKFCCLGVLMHLIEPTPWKPVAGINEHGNIEFYGYGGCTGYPHQRTMFMAGLTTEQANELADMNDGSSSFKAIAKHIEKTL